MANINSPEEYHKTLQQSFTESYQSGMDLWSNDNGLAQIAVHLSNMLNLKQKNHILDIGAGNGRHASVFVEIGCTYVGLDLFAHPEWSKWTEQYGNSVRFVHSSFLEWEPDELFSAVLDNGCFHHQHPDDYRPYLQKVHRSLQTKGLLMLALYPVDGDDAEGALKVMPSGKYKREFSPTFIERLLTANGFVCRDVQEVAVLDRKRSYLQVLAEKVPTPCFVNPCKIVLGPLPASFAKPTDLRLITMLENHEVTPRIVTISDELYIFAWEEAHVQQMVAEVSKHLEIVDICTYDERYQATINPDIAGSKITQPIRKILMVTPWLRYVNAAKQEGFYLVALWDKQTKGHDMLPKVAQAADELYVFAINDTTRLESLIKKLHERHLFDYIYHLGREENMAETYRIAEELGCALNTLNSIQMVNDKYAMRSVLKEHGLSTVQFEHAESVDDVLAHTASFPYPFVIKPTKLSGSRGVYLCYGAADVESWHYLMKQYDYPGPFLIEEFLQGPEVSIESLSVDGEHYIVGITDKIKTPPPLFVELGHVHPSQLPAETQAQIRELVTSFLTVAGYQFGPAHSEVIVTDNGPKLVESQARLGGDSIPKLVYIATGVQMEEAIFGMLNGVRPPASQSLGVAMIRFFQWPEGTVASVEGVEEVRAWSFVHQLECSLQLGDTISTILDSASRYGYVIVSGATHEEASTRMNTVMERIRVIME